MAALSVSCPTAAGLVWAKAAPDSVRATVIAASEAWRRLIINFTPGIAGLAGHVCNLSYAINAQTAKPHKLRGCHATAFSR